MAAAQPAAAPAPRADLQKQRWAIEGQEVWIDVPAGRLKTRVYLSPKPSEHPVLVVVVHGDIRDPEGQGLYGYSETIAHYSDNVVAASVLRPGYRDPMGDVSSGKTGLSIGDNYTAEVVDAVDAAIRGLKAKYHPKAVVLIGHSGGGAISADLIGRHPGDVDAAVLLACGCDPTEFMARFVRDHPGFPKNLPNPSLLPLALASRVSPRIHVRLIVGDRDDVVRVPASEAYYKALKARGIDATLTIAPGFGHNDVLRAPQTRDALIEVLGLEGATLSLPRLPPPPASPRP
jgi:alpha-beta hydrolase superfamily lysophospholipase